MKWRYSKPTIYRDVGQRGDLEGDKKQNAIF